ncbi:APC family permease [Cryomorphaceae bacterium 1068]|nr:APC family permease [Cryomorphaceae bacterium 1068]
MSNPKNRISVFSAAALGVGSMIGAGIFTLLGEAGAMAGSATYLSFLIAGVIALLSGYSYGKIGARFPSSGGIIEYLHRGLGNNSKSATASMLFMVSMLIGLAMVAKTFGNYAVSVFHLEGSVYAADALTVGVICIFIFLNFIGSSVVSKAEGIIVVIKVIILTVFMIAGLTYADWYSFAPATYPGSQSIFGSLAITYFAFTGFAVITTTAGDMANPKKDLMKAILLAIGFTTVLYVGLALVVFGNMTPDEVMVSKETALAQAALPAFGKIGFSIMAITALLSTSSAINANIFALLRMSEDESAYGDLTKTFVKRIWKQGTDGLVIIAVLTIALALFVDLTTIAILGSIANLIVTTAIHIGHFRIRKTTEAKTVPLLAAVLLNMGIVLLFFYSADEAERSRLLIGVAIMILLSTVLEFVIHKINKSRKDTALENSSKDE